MPGPKMRCSMLQRPSRYSCLSAFALIECFLILPAAAFLSAAALRSLQPSQFEPAHTTSAILQWITVRLSLLDAAILFIGLPALVALLGCAAIHAAWQGDATVRSDLASAFG